MYFSPLLPWLSLLSLLPSSRSLIFRSDQFREVSNDCKDGDGKPITYILNEERPALYVSVDPYMGIKATAAANAAGGGGLAQQSNRR